MVRFNETSNNLHPFSQLILCAHNKHQGLIFLADDGECVLGPSNLFAHGTNRLQLAVPIQADINLVRNFSKPCIHILQRGQGFFYLEHHKHVRKLISLKHRKIRGGTKRSVWGGGGGIIFFEPESRSEAADRVDKPSASLHAARESSVRNRGPKQPCFEYTAPGSMARVLKVLHRLPEVNE
jgi:hypothetical protein